MFRQFMPDVLHNHVAGPVTEYPAALIVSYGTTAVNTYEKNCLSSFEPSPDPLHPFMNMPGASQSPLYSPATPAIDETYGAIQ